MKKASKHFIVSENFLKAVTGSFWNGEEPKELTKVYVVKMSDEFIAGVFLSEETAMKNCQDWKHRDLDVGIIDRSYTIIPFEVFE